jgi:transcriptional regulator with XRE-family HTH domain
MRLPDSYYEELDKRLRKSIIQAFQFWLISYRNSRNMSQDEFSRKCGFSRQYISLVESGKRTPSIDFLFNISESFGIDVEELMHTLVEKVLYYESLP